MNYQGKVSDASSAPMYSLLFVCSGNTCRSPMAEVLARKWLREHVPEHEARFRVASAGLAAWQGTPASSGAAKVVEQRGCSLAGHRARMFTPELARGARVIAMTRAHANLVKDAAPGARVTTLAAWAGLSGGEDVRDPFMGSDSEYRACCDQIGRMVDLGLRRMIG
ncbi:MAG: low molecular weight protein arginine phosphatase [Oscillospiraceae bacterium]|jgi:protein-tyrosine-phosphatase|nr:low molecular weight protein arginine phosphatase [Oscillospiraceae bacterium]